MRGWDGKEREEAEFLPLPLIAYRARLSFIQYCYSSVKWKKLSKTCYVVYYQGCGGNEGGAVNELILVVDDEPKITKLAQDYLERSGFRVVTAGDGTTALAQARHERPDLIVLDLNLPGMDGLDVARDLRRESEVPIIMLTARVDETDRLIGLELGADDYITKPFSPRELVARVRAVLRRVHGGGARQSGIVRAGDLEIDVNGHRVSRGGEPIHLTRTEFTLLAALAQNPGQTFTREQLLDRLHGVVYEGFDRSVDSHIKNLRKKLEIDPLNPTYVLTVYGVGYKFADESDIDRQVSKEGN